MFVRRSDIGSQTELRGAFRCGVVSFVAPAIMAGLAVLSLRKVQRRRKRGRYEREPVSAGALMVLAIVAVLLVVGIAIGVNILGGYLYNG